MCPPGLAPHDQQRPGREPDGDLAAGGEAPEHHEDAAGQGQREDGGRGAVVGVHVGRDTLVTCRVLSGLVVKHAFKSRFKKLEDCYENIF